MSNRITLVAVLLVTLLASAFNIVSAAAAHSDAASQAAFVVVDHSQDGFAVFTGIAKNTPAPELDRIKAEITKRPG